MQQQTKTRSGGNLLCIVDFPGGSIIIYRILPGYVFWGVLLLWHTGAVIDLLNACIALTPFLLLVSPDSRGYWSRSGSPYA